MKPENNNQSIKEKNIMSNEVKQFYEQSQKLYEALKKEKGKIYVKNKEKDFNIKLKSKTICKILEQASLIKKLGSYIVIDETSIEIGYSNELYDDDNGKIFQIIQNRNEFPVIMAKDMDLDNEEKIKKQINLKNKSINNILSKIGPIKDNSTYIQISLTQVSFENSSKILHEYIINKFDFLLDSKKIFYIINKTTKSGEEKNNKKEEEEELEKCAISYYSIKKIMEMGEKNENLKDKYLNLSLTNEKTEKYEKENAKYLKNLTLAGENIEIYNKFENNEKNNIKNILEKKVEIKRMEKIVNKEMNQSLNNFDDILNNKIDNKENNIVDNNKNNIVDVEKLQRMQDKKKEIGDSINNRYNRFIEIMHNNKEKKYINLQYLDLMEDFNKKYSKYKIDYYLVKNDRFKDVLIPAECINNYIRYKTEYEKKQFVLVNLNNSENEINYLVSVKELKKLYDEWTDFEKEQIINTENPQFEGKRINLDKAKIVNIGEIKELPEQPDLIKKIKEEKEKGNNEIDKESSKIYGKYPDIYKNDDEKKYIVITRVIKKKKKKNGKNKK